MTTRTQYTIDTLAWINALQELIDVNKSNCPGPWKIQGWITKEFTQDELWSWGNNYKLHNPFQAENYIKMLIINDILGTYGVEGSDCNGHSISYLNAGDTYATTLCLIDNKTWVVTSWGDIIESLESQDN